MASIKASAIGLITVLENGSKVFGALGEDGQHTCFDLTSPEGARTRIGLSDEALAAMVAIAEKLRDGSSASWPSWAVHDSAKE